MSLLQSPALRSISAPIQSKVLQSGAYVLSIVPLPSHYAVSASSPDNAIHLFDKSRLDDVQTLAGHDSSITALKHAPSLAGSSSPVLVSCGKDGVVKAWDARSPSAAPIMIALTAGKPQALLSCDVSASGTTIAAGTELQGEDASLLYWDPRNPAAPLRTHSSTHSDDITVVKFSRQSNSVLLSASSDGLLCTSNAEEVDEDEAALHVGNWGCSIAQAGWILKQNGSSSVWASSDMETMSIWSDELDLVQDIDIRLPSVHREDSTWVTDYVIGSHNHSNIFREADNDLSLFVGSNEGDIALLTRSTFSNVDASWVLSHTWTTGHTEIVRSVLWDEENNVLLTGGEDSKINAWSAPAFDLSDRNKREIDAMDVDKLDSPARKRPRS
ncbi:uncharacterized protein FIBRA_05513 [Fibroporia radiculosa]|uniref:Anaphase-promoting complex subunit 4 WD40 domain-containing protein n=1 Tax=Fibroporia radiculosa TaxID=599839 RepID=J4G9M9_9APHY|nr:uncharacterized protein FIBRA_05513 [Fibroporia radiculosa]CCM03383.1 predicted protein [Fibroporia radiculosa]